MEYAVHNTKLDDNFLNICEAQIKHCLIEEIETHLVCGNENTTMSSVLAVQLIHEIKQLRKERDWLADNIAISARRNCWHESTYDPAYWLKAAKEATTSAPHVTKFMSLHHTNKRTNNIYIFNGAIQRRV